MSGISVIEIASNKAMSFCYFLGRDMFPCFV